MNGKGTKIAKIDVGNPLYMGSEGEVVLRGVKYRENMTIVILIHPSGLIYGVWMNNFGLKTCLRQKVFIFTAYKRLE